MMVRIGYVGLALWFLDSMYYVQLFGIFGEVG